MEKIIFGAIYKKLRFGGVGEYFYIPIKLKNTSNKWVFFCAISYGVFMELYFDDNYRLATKEELKKINKIEKKTLVKMIFSYE